MPLLNKSPILCFVTTADLADSQLVDVVRAAIKGGVNLVQFREKHDDTDLLLERAQLVKTITDQHQVPLLINDRIDIALAVNAAGVHIGQDDMPYNEARRLLGADKIIGLSISSQHEALNSRALAGVDYYGVGPVFDTRSKADAAPSIGLDELANIIALLDKPVIAIGGITVDNIATLPTTIRGIAVVSALATAKDPQAVSKSLWEKLCRVTGSA